MSDGSKPNVLGFGKDRGEGTHTVSIARPRMPGIRLLIVAYGNPSLSLKSSRGANESNSGARSTAADDTSCGSTTTLPTLCSAIAANSYARFVTKVTTVAVSIPGLYQYLALGTRAG